MTYTIDPSSGLVLTTAAGVVTDADVLGHLDALAADPRLPAVAAELADARGVTDPAVTSNGLWRAAAREAAAGPPLSARRLAIVAASDAAFGMSRVYQQLADGEAVRVRVFRDLAAARAWLGIGPGVGGVAGGRYDTGMGTPGPPAGRGPHDTAPIPASATVRVTTTPDGRAVATARGVAGTGDTPEEAVADLRAKLAGRPTPPPPG
jgi:hypothetical protein